jgi:phosphate transport system protein
MTERNGRKAVENLLYATDRQRIVTLVTRMGEITSGALDSAVRSLLERDDVLARRVIDGDDDIDRMEERVDQECLGSIAMRRPGDADLRFVFAALKIITDLERIGDQAVNIAEKALKLNAQPSFIPKDCIAPMVRCVCGMLHDAVRAFRDSDADLAAELWRRDDEVDDMYAKCTESFLESLVSGSCACREAAKTGADELWIVRHLERAGDHAINIAERVFFVVEGAPFPAKGARSGDE